MTSGRSQITIFLLLLSTALIASAQSVPGSVASTQCADGSWHTGYYNCGANGGSAPASNAPRPLTKEEIEARNRDLANKYNAAGNAAMLQKNYAAAIADYQATLSLYHGGIFPDEAVMRSVFRNNLATAMNNQAQVAFVQGNYAAALAEFQQALQLIPDYKKTKNYKQIQANILLCQQRLAPQQAPPPPPPVQVAAAPPPQPPVPPPPAPQSPLIRIGGAGEVHGTVYQLTDDGKKIPITPGTPVYSGEHIVTGADGHVEFYLLDETKFVAMSGCDMVLDEFVYDPNTSTGKVTARLTKGVFRFVSGKVSHEHPGSMKVKTPTADLGFRGTEVEALVNPDNSGYVKLFSGQLDVTENKSGKTFTMDAGQMVTIQADGSIGAPAPMKQKAAAARKL